MKRDKKAKTPKPNFSNLPIVEKKDKLDWQNFNLLENLLIFCTVPNRIAPPESGVSFHITNAQEKSVCLLFEIDRNPDPLITNQKLKRPDYLSLFIQDDLLLFTIIEMKGINKNSTERGIEQITTFRDILKQAIKEHCSSKLKFHLQGILLTPYNSTIPFSDINKEAKTGFIILPVQYSHRAELYSYISKTNTQADLASKNQYVTQKITESSSFLIEELLAKRALDKRKQDDYYSQNFFPSKDRQNIYIDYLLPNNENWITLFANSEQKKIQLAHSGNENQDSIAIIKEEVKYLNLINIVEIVSRSL